MSESPIGVIGGSGLYQMEALEASETRVVTTPFGDPSSPIVLGRLNGQQIAFIARHGPQHSISPTNVNYRANIFAFKQIGVEQMVAVSACGSFRRDYAPGAVVVPNQLLDRTHLRPRSFFDEELVAHVSVADPFCPDLSTALAESIRAAGGEVHDGGSFITIEGPRFSTRAESNLYRAWGLSIIGMTTSPEAFLAREAEICYAVMAHVTDYDVWHRSEEPVTVELVLRTLRANAELARNSLVELMTRLPQTRACVCEGALKDALITPREAVDDGTLERLAPLVKRYYG